MVISSSGSYSFDLEAQGAIEGGRRPKAFGPLPAGYAADYLPIGFHFDPEASAVCRAPAPAGRRHRCGAGPLLAQDTVRVGISYQPGVRPGLVVLPAPGSTRCARSWTRPRLQRPIRDDLACPGSRRGPPGSRGDQLPFYRTLGAAFAVELVTGAGNRSPCGCTISRPSGCGSSSCFTPDRSGVGDSRLSMHRISDEIVRLGHRANGHCREPDPVPQQRRADLAGRQRWRQPAAVTPAGAT